jgi:hypothetical protein
LGHNLLTTYSKYRLPVHWLKISSKFGNYTVVGINGIFVDAKMFTFQSSTRVLI